MFISGHGKGRPKGDEAVEAAGKRVGGGRFSAGASNQISLMKWVRL